MQSSYDINDGRRRRDMMNDMPWDTNAKLLSQKYRNSVVKIQNTGGNWMNFNKKADKITKVLCFNIHTQ